MDELIRKDNAMFDSMTAESAISTSTPSPNYTLNAASESHSVASSTGSTNMFPSSHTPSRMSAGNGIGNLDLLLQAAQYR